jgi:glycerol-3-phosphate acyltransferase PlsY
MIGLYLIIAFIAYVLGSIPFGFVLVKLFRGEDVRSTGSGNIGATNVARTGSKGLAVATLALDALKGAVAVLLARFMAPDAGSPLPYMSVAALAAVLGHLFPVWLRFKGGKGVATALGVFLVLFPKAVLVSLAIFILIVAATRYVSLGSILAAIAFPIAAYFLASPEWQALLPAAAISLLIVIKHRANIGRLLSGTEHRFGNPKTVAEKQI